MLSALVLLLAPIPGAPLALPQSGQTVELQPEKLEGLIESLAKTVEEIYVFPDVAHQIAERLREQLFDGAYEGITLETLAGRLTNDLRSVNRDRHLGVSVVRPRSTTPAPDPARREQEFQDEIRRSNYGFHKVEILEGNIGYLELTGFLPVQVARDTAAGAMAFLANTDALIVDLRANGGGEPSMIQFLCSYFFAERTHLNSFEWRGREGLEEFWTFDDVPGKRMVDVPIFVLTSSYTFSAAEEFTYDLRNLGRATIVGETTGGGAHPGGTHDIQGLLSVFIPQGRAINPITKTNWEGVGVEPHVKITASQALDRARAEAIRVLTERRERTAKGG